MRGVVRNGSSACNMHWNTSQAIQLYDFTDFISCTMQKALYKVGLSIVCS